MALITKNLDDGSEKVEAVGRVIATRTFVADRNHSDTLDYSDYRSTQVTEVLVYLGRACENDWTWTGTRYLKAGEVIPRENRFVWVDVTNIFEWRNRESRSATVDPDWAGNPGMKEDHEVWSHIQAENARIAKEKADAHAKAAQERREKEERDRPVKGKRMVVVRGRKVPKGTVGTVAHISNTGNVLLKDDNVWQDRSAPGVWVSARNLEAR